MAQYINLLLIFFYFGIGLGLREINREGGTLAIDSIRGALSNKRSTPHKGFGNDLQERVLWEAYRMASVGGSSAYDTYVHLDQLLDNSSFENPDKASAGGNSDYDTHVNLDQLHDSFSDEESSLSSHHFDQLLNISSDEEDVIMDGKNVLGLVDYNANYESNQDFDEKEENIMDRDALSGEFQVPQYVNEAHQLEPYNNIQENNNYDLEKNTDSYGEVEYQTDINDTISSMRLEVISTDSINEFTYIFVTNPDQLPTWNWT